MLMFTGTATPYNVLSALVSQDANVRSQLSSFRSMFGFKLKLNFINNLFYEHENENRTRCLKLNNKLENRIFKIEFAIF